MDIEHIVWKIKHKFRNIYYEIRNRFFAKYYRIDIRAMKKGQWADFDFRSFHVLFQMFEEYVLNELGGTGLSLYKYAKKHEKEIIPMELTPAQKFYESCTWWERNFTKKKEILHFFAMDHFRWAINLKNDSSEYPSGSCDRQSESAEKQQELWLWWYSIRPNRRETFTGDENIKHYVDVDNDADVFVKIDGEDAYTLRERTKEYDDWLDTEWNTDEEYELEDTEMMVKLCKIRKELWT